MNKIFRVIWSHATQSWVAVSELTKAHKKAGKAKKLAIKSIVAAVGLGGVAMDASAVKVTNAGVEVNNASHILVGDGAGNNMTKNPGHNLIMIGHNSRVGWNGSADANQGNGQATSTANRGVSQSIAIGGGNAPNEGAWAEGDQSIAIGANVHARGDSSIAIGGDDVDSVANKDIVYTDIVSGQQRRGSVRQAMLDLTGVNIQSPQYNDTVADGAAVAIGVKATAADLSVALGTMARAQKINTVAIGPGSIVQLDNAVAIGGGAKADKDSEGTKEIEVTLGTVTYKFAGGENVLPGDIVSFGAKGFERQLKNIAAGKVSEDSRDAVNGSQLYSLLNTLVTHNYLKYSGDDDDSATLKEKATKVVNQNLDNNKLQLKGGADVSALTDENIGVTYGAGNNIDSAGKAIEAKDKANYKTGVLNIKLAQNLKGLKSIALEDDNKNKTSITGAGITISAPSAQSNEKVSLSPSGLNNGGNHITNVNSNLPSTNNGIPGTATTAQQAPTTGTGANEVNPSNAATVTDILNAGWNIQQNGTAKDFVKAYDTVNFADGTGTQATVEVSQDGKTSTVKYNVKAGDGIEVDSSGNVKVKTKANDNTLTLDSDGLRVNTGNLSVAPTTNTPAGVNPGQIVTNTGDAGKIATVDTVANAINRAYWTATNAGNTVDGGIVGKAGVTAVTKTVTPGTILTFEGGDGIVIDHSEPGTFKFSSKAPKIAYFSVRSGETGNQANDGAKGTNSIAIGPNASVTADQVTSTGTNTNSGIAIGMNAAVSGIDAYAFGKGATSTGANGISIGTNAKTVGANRGASSIAIGLDAVGGDESVGTQEASTALGYQAGAHGDGGTAIGAKAKAYVSNSLAIGIGSVAGSKEKPNGPGATTATTSKDVTYGLGAVAIGDQAVAAHGGTVALGTIANGRKVEAYGLYSMAMGAGAKVGQASNVPGQTQSDNSMALGYLAHVGNATAATAIGPQAKVEDDATYGVALGTATINKNAVGSVAIGAAATVAEGIVRGVALGARSQATIDAREGYNPAAQKASLAGAANAVDDTRRNTYAGLKDNALTSTMAAVSIGGTYNGTAHTRQINHLAAGTADTDAVNVAQLRSVNLKIAGNTNGNTTSALIAGTADADKAKADVLLDSQTLNVKSDNTTYITTDATGNTITISPKTAKIGTDNGGTTTYVDENGKVNVPSTDGLATAQDVANAMNSLSWKVKADKGTGSLTGTGEEKLVKAGDLVTYTAGKNISLNQAGTNFTFSTVDAPEFTNVTVKDAAGNTTTIAPSGVTITKPNVTADDAGNVILNQNGLNNGGNNITNVKGNLPDTKNGAPNTATTNAAAPNTTDKDGNNYISPNNAATVGDILNAGWNIQEKGTAKDFVKAYDTVNFDNGTGTTASVEVSTDGKTSTVKYNVNTGDGLEVDTATNKVKAKAGNGVKVDANGISVDNGDGLTFDNNKLKVDTDGTTITIDNGKVKANTGDLDANSTTSGSDKKGQVKVNNNDSGKLATVDTVAKAVNAAKWYALATNSDAEVSNTDKTDDTTGNGEAMSAGDELTLTAGKNLRVKRDGKNFTFATVENPEFKELSLKDGNNQVKVAPTANGLSLSKGDTANSPVNITGVTSSLTNYAAGSSKSGLVDLSKPTSGTPTVSDNTAATVGDLRNMGWVVSSNKTTGTAAGAATDTAYSGQVKNANEVEFVGTGIATVSGKTDATSGKHTITVHVEPGKIVQSPVVYTTATGEKVVEEDGKFYKAKTDGTADKTQEVAKDQLIASLNNGNNSTTDKPMDLGNVRSTIGWNKDGENASGDNGKNSAITADAAKTAIGTPANGSTAATGLLGKSGNDLNKVATVGDLQAVAQAGLDFNGNEMTQDTKANKGVDIHKTLGSKLVIKGEGVDKNAADAFQSAAGNILVSSESGELVVKLNKELQNLKSAEFKEDGKPTTKITNEGVTITPAAPTDGSTQKPSVSLTENGLSNGGNNITDVKGNLEPTQNSTTANTEAEPSNATKSQAAPNITDKDGEKYVNTSNAATVGDVLNAGWNLQGNGEAVDFVKPFDTVNFVDGNGTTVTAASTDGKTSTVKVDVKAADGTVTVDSTGVKVTTGEITNNTNGSVTGPVDATTAKNLKDAQEALAKAQEAAKADPSDTTLSDAVKAAETKLAEAQKAYNDKGGEKIATVQNVADAINNSGFTLKTSAVTEADNLTTGDLKTNGELIKPSNTVEMIAGKNLTVKHDTNGKITYSTVDAPEFESLKLTKDGNTVNVAPTANGLNLSKPKAGSTTNETEPVNITGVTSNLANYNDAKVNGADPARNSLRDLTNSNVTDNTAATVGDLRNMGWVVSSDKTTEALTTSYSDVVKNANEVKFVGTGLATVSGKTDGNVRTITVDVNAQNTTNSSVTPVEYTKADGTKVYPQTVTNPDGTTTVKFYPNLDGTGDEVPASQVITSVNGPDGTTTPTTLANIKSNLPETRNTDDATNPANTKTTAQAAPNSTNKAGDSYVNPNNAATVGDILNAGWNLQGNGSAVDFVKAYDTVNFVDGKGTKAVVSTDDNLVSRVTFNVDAGTITNKTDGSLSGPTTKELTDALEAAKKEAADNPTDETKKKALDEAQAKVDAANNQVATAQSVVDAINKSGFTLKTSAADGEKLKGTKDDGELIKPSNTVEMIAGKNLTVKQDSSGKVTFATKDDVTFTNVTSNTVNVGEPETYKNAAGDKLVKANNGNFYKADEVTNGVPNEGAVAIAKSDVITDNPQVTLKRVASKPATNNDKASEPSSALNISSTDGKPTQLTGVASTLNTAKVPTNPNGTATPEANQPSLINLNGTTENPVNKNAAATVGDLQNMGWIVSATGNSYLDTVKNANQVDFVGKNGITVTGETNSDGIRTITVEAAQSPIAYTDAEGNKLVKVGDDFYPEDAVVHNGKRYPAGSVIIDGNVYPEGSQQLADGSIVDANNAPVTAVAALTPTSADDVIASLNNGNNNAVIPMTLNNVKSNLPQINDKNKTVIDTNDNIIEASPTTPNASYIDAESAADLLNPFELDEKGEVKRDEDGNPVLNPRFAGNNAATLSDVLNAGWNLQGNGGAVDFVKPFDTVNFVDGGNTTVSVTTDDNLTSKIQVNVTGLPIANTVTVNGKEVPLVKVGDNYYPANADGTPDTTKDPYHVIDGKVYANSDVDPVTDTAGKVTGYKPKADAKPTTLNTNLVNPNAQQNGDQVNTPTQLGNVANGATTFDAPNNANVKMANDGKWYNAADVNPNGSTKENVTAVSNPLTQENATAGLVDFGKSNPNNAATVGDLQNMGWVVSTKDGNGYVDQVRNANKVDFKGESLATVTGKTLEDGTRQITVSVKAGEVVKSNEFTTPTGDKLVKVGNDYYNQSDIDPTTGAPKTGTNPAYKTVDGKVYAANQVKNDGTVEADAPVANVTNNGAGLVTGNQVADAIQKASWTVGKATQALADDKFQNEEDEKVNPNDSVRFADGKGVTVKTATVKSTNEDGSKETTTVVKFDTDLPLDYNKVTDTNGNELKQANDGKWYKADDVADNGTLKPATDGTLPKAVEAKDIKKEGATLADSNSSNGNNPYQTAIEKAALDKVMAEVNALPEDKRPTAEEILAKVADEVAKQEAAEKAGNKDEIKAGTSGVQLNNVGWAVNPDQAVNKDQLDQTVAKSGFFVQQNGKSTIAANAGETDVAKTEKVTPNDVVDFVDGKGTKVKAGTTRDANGVDTTKVSVDVDTGKLEAAKDKDGNFTGAVAGPVDAVKAKELNDNLAKAQKAVNDLPADADEATRKQAADNLAAAEKAADDAGLNKVATAQSVADAINNSGFTLKTSANGGEKLTGTKDDGELINPGKTVEMVAGKNLTVKQDTDGKVTYATKDDVAFNTVNVGAPETSFKNAAGDTVVQGNDGKFYKPSDLGADGKPNAGVTGLERNQVTAEKPQISMKREDAKPATNNGTDKANQPSSALNISDSNGAPTQLTGIASTLNTTEVDTAPNGSEGTNKPKEKLIDLKGSDKEPVNKNAAATVGDLQNMGWVVGADGNGYVDTVKNANKVEFKGGNGVSVTGETNKDGVREITVAIKEGEVTNKVTITDKDGKDTNAVKIGDNYYKVDADGKPTGDALTINPTDKVINNGAGFVTGNTVANAINESGWNVGLADQTKADKAFADETKALSATKLEKVNPDDNVRFANGKNTTVKAATVDEVNKDGKKVTNTYVKVDVELPIGQITAVDADGNKVVKDADGNWYPAKADGTADTSKDKVDPTTVRQSATMDPDKKGDEYTSISDRTSDAALTQAQKDAIAKAEKDAADKVAKQLKDQPASVVKAAQDAAKAEAKDKYLADNNLNKGTGGTVITNVAWGTQPNDAVNVDQLQNSGWNLDSKAVKDSNGKVITGNTAATKVKMDETVNIDAGNNIEITRNGRDIEIATSMDPTFNTVKLGTGNKAVNLSNKDGALNVGGAKITGVAAGDISANSSDAVNGAQIYALAGNQTNVNSQNTKYDTVKYDDQGNPTFTTVVAPKGKTVVTDKVTVIENGKETTKEVAMLKTYNVHSQKEIVTNNVLEAIYNMNEQGIKFFHSNDGVKRPKEDADNDFDSSASGKFATAIGSRSNASGENAVAIGYGSKVSGKDSISIGTGNIVTASNSGAFGDPNYIDGKEDKSGDPTVSGSYAVGNNNVINSAHTFVLGSNVNNSNTKDENGRPKSVGDTVANSVYLGNNTTATAGEGVGTVNFSIENGARKNGNTTTAGDKGKVETATVGNMTYGGFAGATANGVVSVGASNGNERRIQNVAAGEISRTSTDAINGSQLYSVAKGLGDQINNVAGQVNKLGKRMEAGVAGAMAAANLMQPHRSGQSAAMAAIGQHKNQAALAVGYSRISDNGKYGIKLSLGADTQGQVSTGAGVSYFW